MEMILECKSCEKKFIVPDNAITSGGRLVQCSSCGNKWTQFPIKKRAENKSKTSVVKIQEKKAFYPTVKKKKKIKKKVGPSIYSKEYLKIQGDFSPCFGPDNGQQFVAFYMATLNYPRHFQFSRDCVINSISFAGQGTNKGLGGPKKKERMVLNYLLWQNMFALKYQKEYFQRARKTKLGSKITRDALKKQARINPARLRKLKAEGKI